MSQAAPPTIRTRLPQLTFAELWAVLAVALPVLGALLAPISTVDLAYHVRAGGLILDSGAIPSPDPFTFTAAGSTWLDQQWGAQVVLAAIFRLGGWALVATARAILVGLVAWLVLRACRSAGAGMRVAAWLTLAGFAVGLVALAMRPQLLGMVLFALTLAILAHRRRRPGLVWVLPLIALTWANVHGSFFLAPAAIAIAWLEDIVARRPGTGQLLVVAVLAAVATLVNPYGIGAWTYALGLTTNPLVRQLISEWQATSPVSFAGLVFYGSIGGAVALTALAARRGDLVAGRAWPTLLWLFGLAAIGVFAERGVAWWSVAAPSAIAALLGRLAADPPSVRAARGSLANSAIVGVLVVAIVALLPIWRGGDPRYGPSGLLVDAPRGLTDALARIARPGDRIWNAQRWGSWLEFAVPQAKVAVDSRIELIPAEVWQDHLALSAGAADSVAILTRRGVSLVMANAKEQAGLIPALKASGDWRLVLEDADGAVFVRADR